MSSNDLFASISTVQIIQSSAACPRMKLLLTALAGQEKTSCTEVRPTLNLAFSRWRFCRKQLRCTNMKNARAERTKLFFLSLYMQIYICLHRSVDILENFCSKMSSPKLTVASRQTHHAPHPRCIVFKFS